jgi:hypothetical protein
MLYSSIHNKEESKPRLIKTASFKIRKRTVNVLKTAHLRQYTVYIRPVFGLYHTVYLAQKYVPFSIRIVNGPYLAVFSNFTDAIQLAVLERKVTVNGRKRP